MAVGPGQHELFLSLDEGNIFPPTLWVDNTFDVEVTNSLSAQGSKGSSYATASDTLNVNPSHSGNVEGCRY